MNLVEENVRIVYFKYLGAAFGSALISSIYGPGGYGHGGILSAPINEG